MSVEKDGSGWVVRLQTAPVNQIAMTAATVLKLCQSQNAAVASLAGWEKRAIYHADQITDTSIQWTAAYVCAPVAVGTGKAARKNAADMAPAQTINASVVTMTDTILESGEPSVRLKTALELTSLALAMGFARCTSNVCATMDG